MPFALGGAPTAVAVADVGDEVENRVWVATDGRVVELAPRRDGSLAVVATTPLPAGTAATALSRSGPLDFFLDAARARVLVYRHGSLARTLPVGPEPSGMVAGTTQYNEPYVIVANAGSDDLSVYSSPRGLRFGAEERVNVGDRPTAIVAFDGGGAFAVANAGAGTVSQFSTAVPEDGIVRRPAIVVGGTPSTLAAADYLEADLNNDAYDDLVVGDATRGVATVLHSALDRPFFRPSGSYPTGPAAAMVVAQLDRDLFADLAVADRRNGRVLVLHGTRRGRLGRPRVIATGLDPVGLLGGSFGGDYQDDLLVADARSGSVRLLLTPGDRLLSGARAVSHLVAVGARRVIWSERQRAHRHRLALWTGDVARTLPMRASTRRIAARPGRVRRHDAVSYVRCRFDRCHAFAFDLVRREERRLKLPQLRGCALNRVAVWNRTRAFELIGGRRCRGVWIDGPQRPPRHLARFGWLGELRAGRVAFLAPAGSSPAIRVRIGGPVGRVRTVAAVPGLPFGISRPTFAGRHLYWAMTGAGPTTVYRAQTAGSSACPEIWPGRARHTRGLPFLPLTDAGFGVAGSQLFYSDEHGAFVVDRERISWRRSCRPAVTPVPTPTPPPGS